ncbi:MAG: trypsin-like peptidase domain-containing protein [Clostridia bacterium]|nr:trypsin-like peptidase domain-containing protein [Clostridia bacterium]
MDEYENKGLFPQNENEPSESEETQAPNAVPNENEVEPQSAPVNSEPQSAPVNNEPQSTGYSQPNAQTQNPYSQQGAYRQGYQSGAYSYNRNQANPYSSEPYRPYNAQNTGYTPYTQPPIQQGYSNNPVPPKKKDAGKRVFFALIAIILICVIVGTVVFMRKGKSTDPEISTNHSGNVIEGSEESATNPNVDFAISPVAESGALTTVEIAKKGRASCVGILVYANSSSSTAAGQGTGVIAKEDKENGITYIITCAHVIDDAGMNVKVQLEDGTSYDAEVVACDTRTDIGVVKIKATGLNVADFGDSGALQVGSAVYAVGNPGGIEFFGSVTDGIVSAIDRPIDSEIGYTMKCIQHTAAINPGNSGGALVNVYGQIIGINSQKIASTEYEGMGFAIPIRDALEIAEALINYGYVPNRAKLGITYYSLNASAQYSMIAQFNQLPSGTLIINTIDDDSALAGTGAQQYDMIIAVNGENLTTADVLLEKIDNGKVGDKLKLTLCRVNSDYSLERFDVDITLIEDKGTGAQETTTQPQVVYPFDSYGDFYYNFGW